jgi:hypothetical protein
MAVPQFEESAGLRIFKHWFARSAHYGDGMSASQLCGQPHNGKNRGLSEPTKPISDHRSEVTEPSHEHQGELR